MGALEALIKYWKDKYSPAELVEHIGISMDDLLYILEDWVEENLNDFKEDVELIFGYGDVDGGN